MIIEVGIILGLALMEDSGLVSHLSDPRLVLRVILFILVVSDIVLILSVTTGTILFTIVFSHSLQLLLSHFSSIKARRINILVVTLFFLRLRVLNVLLSVEVS